MPTAAERIIEAFEEQGKPLCPIECKDREHMTRADKRRIAERLGLDPAELAGVKKIVGISVEPADVVELCEPFIDTDEKAKALWRGSSMAIVDARGGQVKKVAVQARDLLHVLKLANALPPKPQKPPE